MKRPTPFCGLWPRLRWSPTLGIAALGVVVVTACEVEHPLAIERDATAGFDPLSFDFGAEPEGEILVDKLRFSITPFYTADRQRAMLERMRAWLERKVGVPVEAQVSLSYASAVDSLAKGDIDVAQLSPYACVKVLSKDHGVDLVATAIAQGTTTYASYLVARSDDDIENIQQAKGKRLALTEPWSASGFLYPWAWLRKQGFSPEEDFELVLIGKHDESLRALLDGRVDVAAVSSETLVSRGALGLGGPVRIIAKAGRIPYDCVGVRRAVGPRIAWRVTRAFLELSILTPEGRAVLRDYNLINGFLPLPEGYYDDVKALAEEYGAEVAAAAARLELESPPPSTMPDAETQQPAKKRLTPTRETKQPEPNKPDTKQPEAKRPEKKQLGATKPKRKPETKQAAP